MSLSYSSIDATLMELTPMRVNFKGPSDSSHIDLGGTLSNVVIETKYEKADIKADQLGTTVLDRRVKGLIIQVTTELTQVEDKNIWKYVFPHATEAGTSPHKYIDFKSMVGDSDLANAGELVLHPLSKDNTVLDFDFTFFKACASAESSITYGPDKQAVLKIIWNILPDLSVTPPRFYRHGDSTL